MKKKVWTLLLVALTMSSCGDYNKVLKSTDYQYKYEAAKGYYVDGKYNRTSTLLGEMITMFKGTAYGEESLYMLGMSYFNSEDWIEASSTFDRYTKSYPQGVYA